MRARFIAAFTKPRERNEEMRAVLVSVVHLVPRVMIFYCKSAGAFSSSSVRVRVLRNSVYNTLGQKERLVESCRLKRHRFRSVKKAHTPSFQQV